MKNLKEIRNMGLGTGARPTWRLRSITEEEEVAANSAMADGADSFTAALGLFEEGNREAAVSALRRAVQLAEKAIETIEK